MNGSLSGWAPPHPILSRVSVVSVGSLPRAGASAHELPGAQVLLGLPCFSALAHTLRKPVSVPPTPASRAALPGSEPNVPSRNSICVL